MSVVPFCIMLMTKDKRNLNNTSQLNLHDNIRLTKRVDVRTALGLQWFVEIELR